MLAAGQSRGQLRSARRGRAITFSTEQPGASGAPAGATASTGGGGAGGAGNDRVDRAAWKQMQQHFADTSKFVDMLHNLHWEGGLELNVIRGVERFLAKNKDGELGVYGENSQVDAGDGVLLLVARTARASFIFCSGLTSEYISVRVRLCGAQDSCSLGADLLQHRSQRRPSAVNRSVASPLRQRNTARRTQPLSSNTRSLSLISGTRTATVFARVSSAI